MEIEMFLLVLLSLLPAVGILVYILYMDRIEPEPYSLILVVLLSGGIAVFPAAFLEDTFNKLTFFNQGGVEVAIKNSFFLISLI